jgi:mannose-6-phosphate isomerase-like protein (cupin superfamily)
MPRHPSLVPLSHDHHHGLVVARRLRRAVSEDERRRAAEAFVHFIDGEGGDHFREEEDLLFPLVVASLDESPELVERAALDHIHLRTAAVRLRRAQSPPDAEVLRALGTRLDAHIRLEERALFPLAELVVPESELRALSFAERTPAATGVETTSLDLPGHGTLWSMASADLNANLLAWPSGGRVDEHRNHERDVLLVVVGGGGTLVIDGRPLALRAPQLVVVPRGAARGITAGREGLRYVSAHLRREGLVKLRPPAHGRRIPEPGAADCRRAGA